MRSDSRLVSNRAPCAQPVTGSPLSRISACEPGRADRRSIEPGSSRRLHPVSSDEAKPEAPPAVHEPVHPRPRESHSVVRREPGLAPDLVQDRARTLHHAVHLRSSCRIPLQTPPGLMPWPTSWPIPTSILAAAKTTKTAAAAAASPTDPAGSIHVCPPQPIRLDSPDAPPEVAEWKCPNRVSDLDWQFVA